MVPILGGIHVLMHISIPKNWKKQSYQNISWQYKIKLNINKKRTIKPYQEKGKKDEGEYSLTDVSLVLTKFLKWHNFRRMDTSVILHCRLQGTMQNPTVVPTGRRKNPASWSTGPGLCK